MTQLNKQTGDNGNLSANKSEAEKTVFDAQSSLHGQGPAKDLTEFTLMNDLGYSERRCAQLEEQLRVLNEQH